MRAGSQKLPARAPSPSPSESAASRLHEHLHLHLYEKSFVQGPLHVICIFPLHLQARPLFSFLTSTLSSILPPPAFAPASAPIDEFGVAPSHDASMIESP